jgi:hypothetical protein
MPDPAAARLAHIETVFADYQHRMQAHPSLDEVFNWLSAEPFPDKAVALESVSMETALYDWSTTGVLALWHDLYDRSRENLAAFAEIGLGWALAQRGLSIDLHLPGAALPSRRMVLDGMGYWYGLFRGRRTIKGCEMPAGIAEADAYAFDQGLGRRLWYVARADAGAVADLVRPFPLQRQAALWCGVGLAAAFVGGLEPSAWKRLVAASGSFSEAFFSGAALAAGVIASAGQPAEAAGTPIHPLI